MTDSHETWKVTEDPNGFLAVTNIPYPKHRVIYSSRFRSDAVQMLHHEQQKKTDARKYTDWLIYGAGIAAIIWALLWGAGAYAADITVNWEPPTQNVDGTPLTDLAGYRVFAGETSRTYSGSASLSDPAATSATVSIDLDWLQPGANDIYIAMTAIDADGNESAFSNEIVRNITVSDTTPPGAPLIITIDINVTDCPAGFTCVVELAP